MKYLLNNLIKNNSLKINKPGSSLFMKFSDILDH